MCSQMDSPDQYDAPVTPRPPAIHEVSGQRHREPAGAEELMAIVGRVMDRKFGDDPGRCDVCGTAFGTWEAYCRHLPDEVRL